MTDPSEDRRAWLSVLSRAPDDLLAAGMARLGAEPAHEVLRAPEIGTVMVRGRAGGTGAAFNLGEMTVTRCALRLASGEVGHGHVQGRRKAAARQVALCDALMQTPRAAEVRAAVLDPVAAHLEAAARVRAEKAAATKVEFFTLVRGED